MSKTSTLGSLIRLVRKKNALTLRQSSEKVGIPLATLAKVESDKLSLTYDKLQQFSGWVLRHVHDRVSRAGRKPVGGCKAVDSRATRPRQFPLTTRMALFNATDTYLNRHLQ
jgi:transcriptional regulator with XRE-family HTH domain